MEAVKQYIKAKVEQAKAFVVKHQISFYAFLAGLIIGTIAK